MILVDSFFYIRDLAENGGKVSALLEINPDHQIFSGHFPGQPVVPGVCMMQMVKEIMETVLTKPVKLLNADSLKFLTIIDPTQKKDIQAELKYSIDAEEKIIVTASFISGAVTYFKMNGVFIFEADQ